MSDLPVAILDVERAKQQSTLTSIFYDILAQNGGSYSFIPESLKLTFGQSKVRFDEYVLMRLWDPKFCSRYGLEKFVGNRAMATIFRTANFIRESAALITNKIASSAILEAYGITVPPIAGLHAVGIRTAPHRTSTPEALEHFLLNTLSYPAFGKPLSGRQSLGSISLESCDASSGMLTCLDGSKIAAKAFAQEVHKFYGKGGYIFQPRLVPHEAIRAVCGHRTATVRILTILDAEGPRILRACWKIPAGANSADNFWRAGNLLASIDLDTGVIGQVIQGSGLSMSEIELHPDTKTRIPGMKMPMWDKLCEAALVGAAAMSDFGLLGWDMAATASGPVIVEVNETPELILHQLADRCGMMDKEFKKFLEHRRGAEEIWKAETMAVLRKENTPSWLEKS